MTTTLPVFHQPVRGHAQVGMPFPPDGRERVQQTTQPPWSGLGLLSATMPDGEVLEATAFAIAPQYVVTAAHAVYDHDYGGRAVGVTFAAARDAGRTPFGVVKATTWTYPGQYPSGGRPYDYCLVRLAAPLPSQVTSYRLTAAPDRDLEAGTWQVAGYPDDKSPENSLWYDSGKLLSPPGTRILRYRISTSGGQSGAPVSPYLDERSPAAVGVHAGVAADKKSNEAVRLTREVIEEIESWK
ncbi:trypsin-like serine peptidase [Amycolatopsis australiensis]|uniref:Serine protease n=1 Tax=Amycolatopsis australiensis TaxID=546364 RepID=A0A1K1RSF8_9PSEU|nr:trypsin-like peptidase domain-containing protein [Amycolatopsis australiensis]SFW75080.1 V8-like Glu-specific endopeptidase [Amycolatopsis australiensis]